MNNKKLYRSSTDKMWLGVLGGVAEYFGVDSTLVRLAFAVFSIFMGGIGGVILYFVSAAIMPLSAFTVENPPRDDKN